jgi:hypothetical protein
MSEFLIQDIDKFVEDVLKHSEIRECILVSTNSYNVDMEFEYTEDVYEIKTSCYLDYIFKLIVRNGRISTLGFDTLRTNYFVSSFMQDYQLVQQVTRDAMYFNIQK